MRRCRAERRRTEEKGGEGGGMCSRVKETCLSELRETSRNEGEKSEEYG